MYQYHPFRAACVQISSQREITKNIAATIPMIERAAKNGADLILLPETVDLIEPNQKLLLSKAKPESTHAALKAFRKTADRVKIWLLIGSLTVKSDNEKYCTNRCYLIGPTGEIAAFYDKIHLFDANLEGRERYQESKLYQPGNRAVIAVTPWGGLGMTICYDLCFAYLFRKLAQRGAHFISVPAAFTRPTGKAHWHTLLRARAIETGCFILAPAQCGSHAAHRLTYGHSLIVDPWGNILAEGGEEQPGIIIADIDPIRVEEVRHMIPALIHDRRFTEPTSISS